MSHATFSAADMTAYRGLEELGLVAVGMRCQGGGFVLKCRAASPARLCPGCGRPGYSLGSRTRRLAHEPRGHQPTTLAVYVGRYHCRACSRSWCDDISQAAPPRAKLSFGALRWGLVCLIADNMSMNRIAAHLAVAWHTANEAILAYGEELLLADSTRFEGVRAIGVDEHVWRHRGGARPASWTWCKAAPHASCLPGWPRAPKNGRTTSRSWRWMGSVATKAQQPASFQGRWQ